MRSICRRAGALLSVLLVLSALVWVPAARAAEPPSGTISPENPSVSWSGEFLLPGQLIDGSCSPLTECDSFTLTIEGSDGHNRLRIEAVQGGLVAVTKINLYDGDEVVAEGGTKLEAADVPNGTYRVEIVNGNLDLLHEYTATATLEGRPPPVDPGSAGGDSVGFDHDPDEAVASASVPLRVVMVGFQPGEVDRDAIFAQIPNHQRVSSLYTYDGAIRGGSNGLPVATLLNKGRSYYDDPEDPPFLLPLEMRWEPELHYAPSGFTRELFEHMVANSTTGDYADVLRRVFLDAYNATRGTLYRVMSGGAEQAVLPGAPVRFVDGEAVEDWIAENSERHLGFPAGRDPGEPGYTLFVLNTWDSPEALEVFPAGEYHVFRVNRTDPDRGDFDGVDWARIWGGRYRFMMLDLGAAPNPYESETWANRGRSVLGSTLHDPPIWEFRAGAPRLLDGTDLVQGIDGFEDALTDPLDTLDQDDLVELIARTLNEAVNFRFFHSYLYEPRPGTGRFFLSDNIWHDSPTLYRSDLQKLYDQEAALAGLRTLTPYFTFDGDVVYQYLEDLDANPEYPADKAALDAAKLGGDDVVGVPALSLNTSVMMDYIDSKPERFLRGGLCYTTVPTIQVVVPGHFAWALPIAAGIATNRGGVPWGFLNSVNDVTKWNGADKDQTLVLAHPNILFNGVFTYTTIHEASHYLGLAHPHDTVGAERNDDGSPRYYDGFTWSFNTTASPTTYSHVETVYSILDQESIARGHLAFYLQWTFEVLQETGAELNAAGTTKLSQLDAATRELRATAIRRAEEAQRLFADFDFVRATFAAQEAWKAAATFRDAALDLEPGTTQVEYGTQNATDAELEAAGCVEAKSVPEPVPAFNPGPAPSAEEAGFHVHGVAAERLPATGDASRVPFAVLLLGAALTVAAVTRLARHP